MSTRVPTLPVRVYETDRRIMVAAPMPGLEPKDIAVTVAGDHVTIHGKERGPHQHKRRLLVAQWAIGPYDADLKLAEPVNGALTNATYGNGILVLAMPKLRPSEPVASVDIRLTAVSATRGERVGHVSRTIRSATTAEHLRKHRPDSL